MKKYKKREMNEMDLISEFSKEQLYELLKIQIEHENYEGAKVVKSAIDQYDECFNFDVFFNIESDENNKCIDDVFINDDEENEEYNYEDDDYEDDDYEDDDYEDDDYEDDDYEDDDYEDDEN